MTTLNESDDIVQIRDTVRRFVEKEVPRSLARSWDADDHFPRELFGRMAELGLMTLTVPEAYGGCGRDIPATMAVIEELSKRSMALAIPYIMASCYAAMNLVEFGSDAQKTELLPRVADGTMMFAYGWTEPDVGADLASVQTSAERDGDRLIVNGQKRFCTGAAISDIIYTLVRTGDRDARYRNLSFILIPRDAPGVSISPIDSLGIKGPGTYDVVFDNVEVPLSAMMGGEAGWNRGWEMLTGAGLDVEKLEVAAMALGIAEAALEDSWVYAQQRRQFGRAIIENQSIQHALSGMAVKIHGARLMLDQAAALANIHRPCAVETSMAKLQASEVAKAVALECMTIHGAYGYVAEVDAERYVRDALAMPIIGGSTAIQLNNIYKALARSRAS